MVRAYFENYANLRAFIAEAMPSLWRDALAIAARKAAYLIAELKSTTTSKDMESLILDGMAMQRAGKSRVEIQELGAVQLIVDDPQFSSPEFSDIQDLSHASVYIRGQVSFSGALGGVAHPSLS